MAPTFEQYQQDYATRWASMQIRPELAASARTAAEKVLGAQRHYEPVSGATGVPWQIIGIIHQMECGGSFRGNLCNGDPLTARTVQVPRGRPASGKPPFTWEEAAIDAIQYDGLDKVTDWGPERLAYALERYNGFGYRKKGVPSAYLWSGSNQYVKGKYVRDGVWSSEAVSGQIGGMPILKALMELDPAFSFGETLTAAAAEFPKTRGDDEAAHLEAHAELKDTSTVYAAVDKTAATAGGGTIAGGGLLAVLKGAVDHTEQITLTPDGIINQIGATAQIVTKYGLPLLGLAFVLVMGCEVVQFYQRKKLMG